MKRSCCLYTKATGKIGMKGQITNFLIMNILRTQARLLKAKASARERQTTFQRYSYRINYKTLPFLRCMPSLFLRRFDIQSISKFLLNHFSLFYTLSNIYFEKNSILKRIAFMWLSGICPYCS